MSLRSAIFDETPKWTPWVYNHEATRDQRGAPLLSSNSAFFGFAGIIVPANVKVLQAFG